MGILEKRSLICYGLSTTIEFTMETDLETNYLLTRQLVDRRSIFVPIEECKKFEKYFEDSLIEIENKIYKIPVFSDELLFQLLQTLQKEEKLIKNDGTLEGSLSDMLIIEDFFVDAFTNRLETFIFINHKIFRYLIKNLNLEGQSKIETHLLDLVSSDKHNLALELSDAFFYNILYSKLSDEKILSLARTSIAIGLENSFWEGVTKFVQQNPKRGENIVDLIKVDYTVKDANFLRCIFSALFKIDPINYFQYLSGLFEINEWKAIIIGAFSLSIPNDEILITNVLNVIEEIDEDDIISQQYLAYFYGSVVSYKDSIKEITASRCESGLFRLLADKRVELQNAVINAVNLKNTPIEIIHKIAISLLKNPHHTPDFYRIVPYQFNIIDTFYSVRIKSIDLFIEFLVEFVKIVPGRYDGSRFPASTQFYLKLDLLKFSKAVLLLLYNDLGKIRMLGSVLLDQIIEYNGEFRYTTDLIQLSEQEQVKYILTINYGISDFLKRFRLAIPLFNSTYINVVQLLVGIIKEKIYGYPLLVDILEQELPLEVPARNSTLDILRKWKDEVAEVQVLKSGLKELSPVFCQARIYSAFNKKHNAYWKAMMDKNIRENSIVSVLGIKKIPVARGGGWKPPGAQQARPLNKIETTISIPAAIFEDPEKFTYEVNDYYSTNWSTEIDLKKWLKRFL